VARWFKPDEHDGLQALGSSHRRHWGKKPRIRGDLLSPLHEQLNHPDGFQGYQSICTGRQDRFGLEVPYKPVQATVYAKLKGKPNVARTSHGKKDPLPEDTFKKKSWRNT
jgi:hypothetical protein